MTSDQGRPSGPDWPPPTRPISTTRPTWALPTLVAGIVCSVIVAVVSAQYFEGQAQGEPPSLAMAYMFYQVPFLLASAPLLLMGSLATIRPWSHRRPWLLWLVVAGVIVWLLLVLQGPALFVS